MQTPFLCDDEEQKEAYGAAGAEKILSAVPKARKF